MIVRDATQSDVDIFYTRYHGEPLPFKVDAIVGESDSGIEFVFGLHQFKSGYVAFSDSVIDAKKYKKAFVIAGNKLLSKIESIGKPVIAVAQGEVSFLLHFGFKRFSDRIYKWVP